MAARIFIDGEAGTTGLGIRERLRERDVVLCSIEPDRRRDPQARLAMMQSADLVVLCLPDDAAREAVRLAGHASQPPRLLDASTAHRTDAEWVYGFAELVSGQRAAIAAASRVANPGCYATGAVALLHPLVSCGVIAADTPLSINAVSGYSGGGRNMIEAHETNGGPAFELYGLGLEHKHVPEIMAHSGLEARPVFVPSVGHFRQGMIVSIPLHLDRLGEGVRSADVLACLEDWYAGSDHVQVGKSEASLVGEAMSGSDAMRLAVHASEHYPHALLTAHLDNLGKGASGAAIQNISLMLGIA